MSSYEISFPDYFKSELMETVGRTIAYPVFSFSDYFKSELMETWMSSGLS